MSQETSSETVQMQQSSEIAKSMGGGDLAAWPLLERAPLMHWMAERRREKVRRQCNQDMVEEYEWSHLYLPSWSSVSDGS